MWLVNVWCLPVQWYVTGSIKPIWPRHIHFKFNFVIVYGSRDDEGMSIAHLAKNHLQNLLYSHLTGEMCLQNDKSIILIGYFSVY